MVGHDGYVCTHGGQWVEVARAVLDLEAFDGIGVVRAPDLRRVVQHAHVEAAATRGASFDDEIREALQQPFEQIVDAQNITMVRLALVFGAARHIVAFGDEPVHIPFDVCDVRLVEQSAHLPVDVVDHVLVREVQKELVAAVVHMTAGCVDRPVRVRTVQVGILVHHLRFEP